MSHLTRKIHPKTNSMIFWIISVIEVDAKLSAEAEARNAAQMQAVLMKSCKFPLFLLVLLLTCHLKKNNGA